MIPNDRPNRAFKPARQLDGTNLTSLQRLGQFQLLLRAHALHQPGLRNQYLRLRHLPLVLHLLLGHCDKKGKDRNGVGGMQQRLEGRVAHVIWGVGGGGVGWGCVRRRTWTHTHALAVWLGRLHSGQNTWKGGGVGWVGVGVWVW